MFGFQLSAFANEISKQLSRAAFPPLWRMLPNFPLRTERENRHSFSGSLLSVSSTPVSFPSAHGFSQAISSMPPVNSMYMSSIFQWTSDSVVNNLKAVFDRLSVTEKHVEPSNVLPQIVERSDESDRPGKVTLPSLSELGLLSYGRLPSPDQYASPSRSPSIPPSPSLSIRSLSDSGSEYESLSDWMEGLSLND